MKIVRVVLAVLLLCMVGCVDKVADIMGQMKTADTPWVPSDAEVVSALKGALKIGAESASKDLSSRGAYYSNNAYKILLPPEANTVIANISKIPGGDKLVEDVILRVNTAAEDAAAKAVPIFTKAVTGMTIKDGMNILMGEKDSATRYLERVTGAQIKDAYRPELKAALQKPMIAGISAEQSWNTLTGKYNTLANSLAGRVAKLEPVTTNLDDYVLDKAVTALFTEVALEEGKIREAPLSYAEDIVRKVFNYAKAK